MTKVSIIMPAYNAEKTIEASIGSVLSQTFADWELIIIDDVSQDQTIEIVQKLADSDQRVILHVNEKNSGVSQARNKGIGYAKGTWLAFLDSDDLWHEDKLKKQLRFIKETGAVISYTATAYINESGEKSDYILSAERNFTYKKLLKRNLMSCSSVMVRRDVMVPFPLEREIHEDYVVWLTLVKEVGCAHGLDEPLLIYRMMEGSKSSGRITSAKMIYNAYHHPQIGYGKIEAIWLTLRYALHSIRKRIKIGKIWNSSEKIH